MTFLIWSRTGAEGGAPHRATSLWECRGPRDLVDVGMAYVNSALAVPGNTLRALHLDGLVPGLARPAVAAALPQRQQISRAIQTLQRIEAACDAQRSRCVARKAELQNQAQSCMQTQDEYGVQRAWEEMQKCDAELAVVEGERQKTRPLQQELSRRLHMLEHADQLDDAAALLESLNETAEPEQERTNRLAQAVSDAQAMHDPLAADCSLQADQAEAFERFKASLDRQIASTMPTPASRPLPIAAPQRSSISPPLPA